MDIGKRIRIRRKELKMSVDELAQRLNKNRATIYRYEKGEIGNLPMDILEPLANAIQTTPQYLLGWTRPSSEEKDIELIALAARNWYEEFGPGAFTKEEVHKLIEYGRFLISQRTNKENEK